MTAVILISSPVLAIDCNQLFDQRLSHFQTTTVQIGDMLVTSSTSSKRRLYQKKDFPGSERDVFIIFNGSHVALHFRDRVLESLSTNHLKITASTVSQRDLPTFHGVIIRISNLNDRQYDGMSRMVGLLPDGPVCYGFTCAQVATQALSRGAGIHTSFTGTGNLTISAMIRKFAQLQASENPNNPARVSFYTTGEPLDKFYSDANRYDREEITEAGKTVAIFTVFSSSLALVATFLVSHIVGL
jgi:hypothetical protein